VGASAGGLEPLQAFFRELPTDTGAAYVVITHQKAGRVSLLPELLGRETEMPVHEAAEGMHVRPNTVYVGTDQGTMEIADGELRFGVDEPTPAVGKAIDRFLRSLAADCEELAACVILSGAGSDGTVGAREIKGTGGLVMAQEPTSAKYASMPSSVQSTGLADFILPPDQLPAKLAEYLQEPFVGRAVKAVAAPRLSPEAVRRVLVALRGQTGQDFTGYKESTMSRRIERRMAVQRIEKPVDYAALLRESRHEAIALVRELLISVTRFFRDPAAFEALANCAIPEMLAGRDDGYVIRVWVPGCATGEEAYSVAILLYEQMQRLGKPHRVQVFATDLDERAIEHARAGFYPQGIADDVSAERLERYFTPADGGYRIEKDIREMMVFAVQNLIKDPPFMRLDLLICRNVLIYLQPELQKKILPVFHYALRPGGVLFLGSSESLAGQDELFESLDGRWKILRRSELPSGKHPSLELPVLRGDKPKGERTTKKRPPGAARTAETLQRAILSRFAPPSVVVDGQGQVVYIQGRTGLYLEPPEGSPSADLLKMCREGLASSLASALRNVRSSGQSTRRHRVRVRSNGDYSEVDLTVAPLEDDQALRDMLLVTFTPSKALPGTPEQDASSTDTEADDDRQQLERELLYTRESLQSTVEELETANEELQSSNEELQSTNEELQSANEELETSKEEMQALNEELKTVNDELEAKVEDLARANDDMNNLLNSMQVATVFLDGHLRVKRYTDKAKESIPLIESDVGRPISDLAVQLDTSELPERCRRVLATLVPDEFEAVGPRGGRHLVRIMPYRTADNVIDGVVVTIVELPGSQVGQINAEGARDFFKSIVNTVREPLLVLDDDLRVQAVNESFCKVFDTAREESLSRLIYRLGNGQWDVPALRELLEHILPEDEAVDDFEVSHEFPRLGQRTFRLNARRLKGGGQTPNNLILLAMQDVTGESQ
jgi:two-component system CheB/CheR fusion protein